MSFTRFRLLRPRLELTLAILKPDVCSNPNDVQAIREIILRNGFYFIKSTNVQLTKSQAEEFYAEHRGKFFLTRLVSFMSSGPIAVHAIARDNAIQQWRSMMGPTKVFRALHEQPECIRAKFGLTDTRNAVHGSDSQESAAREIGFFFTGFSVEDWVNNEEPLFRDGHAEFVPDSWIHKLRTPIEQEVTNFTI